MFEKITRYIEPVEKGKFSGEYVSPFRVDYSPTAENLMDAVYEYVETYTHAALTQYNDILRNANIERDDRYNTDVTNRNAETVLALLIASARQEKYCTGAWLEAYTSGALLGWMYRLKELDEMDQV